MNHSLTYKHITPGEDAAIAAIIRSSLKARGLDRPGTAYYDDSLDHLSEYYSLPGRAYYILFAGGTVAGGIGFAEFPGFENCCELQKLYLSEEFQGNGIGYDMMRYLEDRARLFGYERIYLETHSNLKAAIHLYEKTGYRMIERPQCVVHSAMDRFYCKELPDTAKRKEKKAP